MLIISNGFAYRLCAISNDNNNDCIDECPKGKKPIHKLYSPNYCGKECNTKYTFIPNEYCINECDENIYSINEKNECGLCKDLYNNRKFKMINYTGCLEKQPENSHFINEKLYLIACNNGLKFIDGKCGDYNCHKNCELCYFKSFDDNNQKCISCKDKFLLKGENCVDNCSDGFFENNKKCEVCDISCKKCHINSKNCIECNKGYYFGNDNKCEKCSDYCETCFKGEENDTQNCLSCNLKSEFKYFFNNNCYKTCPENTTENDNNICIYITNNENNLKSNDEKNLSMFIFFIIIASIFLSIIIIYLLKTNCCESKNQYNKVINELYT